MLKHALCTLVVAIAAFLSGLACALWGDALLHRRSLDAAPHAEPAAAECCWVDLRIEWQLRAPPRLCARCTNDALSNVVRAEGKWPDCDDLLVLLRGHLPEGGGVFVDAGANIGACTLLVAGQGFETHAFEPQPDNLRHLRASIGSLSMVHLHAVALGEASGGATIYRQEGNAGNSVVGVAHPDDPTSATDRAAMLRNAAAVEVRTLDEELPGTPNILLMKLDVQGFEVKVLRGARRLLAAGAIAAIKTELAPAFLEAQGSSQRELCQLLLSEGFTLHQHPHGPAVSVVVCAHMRGDLYALKKRA